MKRKPRILKPVVSVLVAVVGASTAVGQAHATNEAAAVDLTIVPSGNIYKEVRRPVDWTVGNSISTADPSIYPLRRASLQMSPSIGFFPRAGLPVCPDTQIGPPPTNVSVPVDLAVARCPNSVIGNGTASFQLAGLNGPIYQRDGYIVIFNGGRQANGPLAGRPKIKVYAYSYGTGAGVYTEGVLTTSGALVFEVPRLTADSAVTSLNLNIPGQVTPITDPAATEGSEVPAGIQANYVRASCPGTSWGLSGTFLLGNRNNSGDPVPPEAMVDDSDTQACAGLVGRAKFGRIGVKGPRKIVRNRKTRFKVAIPNGGTATARRVVLRVRGRGVYLKRSIGRVAPETRKRVKVRLRFRKEGKVRVTFLVRASNATSKKAVRMVRVR